MKRFLISISILVIIVAAVFYFSAGIILTQLTDQGIRALKQNAGKYGFQVTEISIGSTGLASFNAVQWLDIELDIAFIAGDRDRNAYRVNAEMENISLTLADFGKKIIKMKLKNLKAFRVTDQKEYGRNTKINQTVVKISEFKTQFKMDFTSFKKAESDINALIQDIRGLITHGRTYTPMEFKGNCLFGINEKPETAAVQSEKRGNEFVIIMSPEDLRRIAQVLEEDLNEPEIQLLSKNPLRAPRMLKIRNKARSKAEQAYSVNRNISEDAYRHVLWSYLLTVQYGEAFAKLVTDAHEQGDFEDSDADHKMDYHNNAIGRSYAKARLPEQEVLQKAARDSRVIGFVNRVS